MISDRLEANIATRISIPPTVMEAILDKFETKTLKKGAYLLQSGATCKYLYFIEKGCARTYAESPEREITSWFYPEDHFVTSWYSFLQQQPSFEYVQMLEESVVRMISYESLQELYRSYPEAERMGRLIMEEQLSFIDYFSRGYLFLTAKERYELLLSYFPEAPLRVKLGHIASFLGITQETLSRIRSQK